MTLLIFIGLANLAITTLIYFDPHKKINRAIDKDLKELLDRKVHYKL